MSEPTGPLRAARTARKWSQTRAAHEIAALAHERGIAVAAPMSLKTQLSRWENGHALPEAHYRTLLGELYASTEEELGLAEPAHEFDASRQSAESLVANLSASSAVDEEGLRLLRDQLDIARRLDRRLGAAAAEDSVRAQLSHLERILLHAIRPRVRRQVAALVAGAAALAARHSLDRSRPSEAWSDYDLARAAARDAESWPLLSYALARQSSILLDLGEHEPAMDILEQASGAMRDDAPGPLRAWLSARRGHTLAVAGERESARSAYRLAERQLGEQPRRIDIVYPEMGFLKFDGADLLRHRGHTRLVMREDTAAIDDLEEALRSGDSSTRQLGGTHAGLARALGATGHPAEAAEHARSARDIATRIGSLRLAARLGSTDVDSEPVRA
ncbi:hypothetical protein [Pseudonocardia spinosispora]|uniref:hypothetical protein n=1 Tax=Pseudonocardia spinosispora TaxID=103441 RepID=UPI00041144A3|nr:hypothetical protein [Pseudonocardia spinosispora]